MRFDCVHPASSKRLQMGAKKSPNAHVHKLGENGQARYQFLRNSWIGTPTKFCR